MAENWKPAKASEVQPGDRVRTAKLDRADNHQATAPPFRRVRRFRVERQHAPQLFPTALCARNYFREPRAAQL